ncbi:MAG: 2-dehydro-3-deoxygalactonokinase [Deltaproteobacteria bacterium]
MAIFQLASAGCSKDEDATLLEFQPSRCWIVDKGTTLLEYVKQNSQKQSRKKIIFAESMMENQQDWVAVDWGTTHFRIWRMHGDKALEGREASCGLLSLKREEFEPTLKEHLHGWPTESPVLMSGMVGSRQGWQEAPYLFLPVSLKNVAIGAVDVQTKDLQRKVHVLPGVACQEESRPDVMRGEETQMLGLGAGSAEWSGMICLPGTHCKWVKVALGQVQQFDTYLTGELFSILRQHSILRHDLESGDVDAEHPAFAKGVSTGFQESTPLLTSLFRVRATSLLLDRDPVANLAFLSGRLLGEELRSATQNIGKTEKIQLVGGSSLTKLYARALSLVGREVDLHSGDDLVRLGLTAAWQFLYPQTE